MTPGSLEAIPSLRYLIDSLQFDSSVFNIKPRWTLATPEFGAIFKICQKNKEKKYVLSFPLTSFLYQSEIKDEVCNILYIIIQFILFLKYQATDLLRSPNIFFKYRDRQSAYKYLKPKIKRNYINFEHSSKFLANEEICKTEV